MQKLSHHFTSTCQRTAAMIDKKSFVKLDIRERILMAIHLSYCPGCKVYKKQSRFLDKLILGYIHQSEQMPILINNELKEKLKTYLKKNF